MAKKKNSKLVPIFSLIIIIAGLVVAAFLIRRPQNFKPQAAVSDPLAGVSAVASGSSCQCTGSTSACANFATQNKCTANKKCQWACPAQATVTSPNGGEVWQRGKTYRITWNQTQAAGSTGLFLYTRGTGGDTYLGAIAYYVSNKEGANYYDWTIGASGTTNPPDGNNIIVAVGLYDSNASLISSDKSNNPFALQHLERVLAVGRGFDWFIPLHPEFDWRYVPGGYCVLCQQCCRDQYLRVDHWSIGYDQSAGRE